MSRAFEWVTLTEGRARFSGGSGGGAEELAHDTFAVDLDGRELFGEVRKRYDGEALYLEVPTFGYALESRVGIPEARTALAPADVARTQRLVCGLAERVSSYPERDDRPYVLRLSPGTTYANDVRFEDGWVVVADESTKGSA